MLLTAARWYRTRRPAPTPFTDEDISSIAIPLLLLLGGNSQMIDSTAAATRIQTLQPEADVRVLPGVGHGPGFEHGSTVNAALAEFIDSHSRR